MSFRERFLWTMALLATIWGLAVLQAKSVMIGSVFCGVIFFMTAVLLWVARLAARYLGRVQVRSWQLRHALSSFRRPNQLVLSHGCAWFGCDHRGDHFSSPECDPVANSIGSIHPCPNKLHHRHSSPTSGEGVDGLLQSSQRQAPAIRTCGYGAFGSD